MTGEEFTQLVTQQMLDKMEHYRSILRETVEAYYAEPAELAFIPLMRKIKDELAINPEWEVLQHVPHMGFPPPDAYKAIEGPVTDDPDRNENTDSGR